MKKINEVIVVEGAHDASIIKQYLDADTIITNGSAISPDTLELIKKTNETRGVIVFLDPDFPGEKIRQAIIDYVPDAKHAYLTKQKAVSKNKKKIGIEHASKEDIIQAIADSVSYTQKQDSLSYQEYLKLGLVANKALRNKVSTALKIAPCNAKTLYKRLNMLNLTYEDLIKIIGE